MRTLPPVARRARPCVAWQPTGRSASTRAVPFAFPAGKSNPDLTGQYRRPVSLGTEAVMVKCSSQRHCGARPADVPDPPHRHSVAPDLRQDRFPFPDDCLLRPAPPCGENDRQLHLRLSAFVSCQAHRRYLRSGGRHPAIHVNLSCRPPVLEGLSCPCRLRAERGQGSRPACWCAARCARHCSIAMGHRSESPVSGVLPSTNP